MSYWFKVLIIFLLLIHVGTKLKPYWVKWFKLYWEGDKRNVIGHIVDGLEALGWNILMYQRIALVVTYGLVAVEEFVIFMLILNIW